MANKVKQFELINTKKVINICLQHKKEKIILPNKTQTLLEIRSFSIKYKKKGRNN